MESSTETMSAVYDIHHATVPSEEDRRSRIIPGLPSISQSIRKTIITLTEPLSPSQSEIDLESGPSTPSLAFEKLRRWSTSRKSETSSLAPRPLTPREHPSLTNLPHELQILILTFLGFGDIEHLRRTSRYWYNFATPRLVRSIYGPDTFRAMLIKHCRVCLTYCPRDVTRVATTRFDPGFPLSSRCVKCTVQSKDGTVRIGHRVKLGNLTDVWTCRWCGWPVTGEPSAGNPQFHRNCYDKYTGVLLGFFALGWIQFFIGVVASALVWFYFRDNLVVMAPTIAGFALMFVCIILIMFRGNRVRTYHWALLIELAMVGLWVSYVLLHRLFFFSLFFFI